MITVEFNADDESVALYFDESGGQELLEIIKELITGEKNDHVHLTDCSLPSDLKAKFPNPRAINLEKLSKNDSAKIGSLMTVLYRNDKLSIDG